MKGKSSSDAFLTALSSMLKQVEDTDHWRDDIREILDAFESDLDAQQEEPETKATPKMIKKADFGKPGV